MGQIAAATLSTHHRYPPTSSPINPINLLSTPPLSTPTQPTLYPPPLNPPPSQPLPPPPPFPGATSSRPTLPRCHLLAIPGRRTGQPALQRQRHRGRVLSSPLSLPLDPAMPAVDEVWYRGAEWIDSIVCGSGEKFRYVSSCYYKYPYSYSNNILILTYTLVPIHTPTSNKYPYSYSNNILILTYTLVPIHTHTSILIIPLF